MHAPEPWRFPPQHPRLARDEVHIWRAYLDSESIEEVFGVLSIDEWQRAARFCFQRDRERFIAARGILRAILSRYLGITPRQVGFGYNPYGRPFLSSESGGDMLHFNIAHSRDLALYALTREREIGVDLEYVCADRASESAAEQFFSPRETAVLRALPKSVRTEAFFKCWTRKEAYVKARGHGLALPLSEFDVSLNPGEPAQLLRVKGDPHAPSRWSLHDLCPVPGYVATVAVEGRIDSLKCWQWQLTS